MTLEKLLNILCEKGWKPFGRGYVSAEHLEELVRFYYEDRKSCIETLRTLTSKESGLWQFCCENGMYRKNAGCFYFNDERAKNVFYKIDQFDEEGEVIQTGDMEGDRFIHISEPEYRLIESALCDEEDLEKFLLDNIKI